MEDRTIIHSAASSGSVRRGVRLNGIYEVGPLIAYGGMGEVYRGFNIVTNDPVAIKMILPELSGDPDAFAMFKREASTLLNLHHEAIVRYFVFSVDPELQRAYLAMEFVDGPSLKKRLASGALPVEEVRILQRRLADALDAAHRLGVIHRDISSDNVILPGGDPRRAKIIDFGIARSLRLGEGTILGSRFAGKYNYASPEQLGLAGGEVGPKSDIYSLGLVLAEALLGRAVDMGGSQAETIEKRRKVPDLSPIDPSMRPLIAAMLQPSPNDRPESMAAVGAWSADRRPHSRAAGGAQESSSFGRIAAIAAALIVIVSVGGTLYAYRDVLPWRQSPLAASTPDQNQAAPPAKPAPQQEANVETTPPPHNLPALPEPPLAPSDAASAPPPALSPAAEPPTPAQPEKPTTQPAPHVPTADELVNALKAPKKPSDQPPVVALNQSAAGEQRPSAHSSPPPIEPKLEAAAPTPKPAPKVETPAPAPKTEAAAPKPKAETPAPAPVLKAEAAAPKPKAETPAPAPVLKAEAAAPPPKAETPSLTPAPKPAPPLRASRDQLLLDQATVGKEYLVDLPPFSDPADPKGVALHAEPTLPEGLALADLGQGFGRISGTPNRPGQYSFSIVASDASGATARMAAQLAVAAPEPIVQASATPTQPPAPPPPAEGAAVAANPPPDAAAFLRDFNGGPCFFARSAGFSGVAPIIFGVGADKQTFQRFYEGLKRTLGVEPDLTVRLIASSECPAISLIGASGASAAGEASAPKIELTNYDVGRNKPLAGTVSNLSGRNLALLLISSDGQVHRIETQPRANGASATFSVPIVGEGADTEVTQIVIAIASAKPLPSLAKFKSGAAADILPRAQSDLAAAGGALETEFFKFVN